ncbi:MAG TPA: hypothetical protein PLX60_02355 [Chitinophagales bacterium]|jgi:hypothetical protein|nr:hypothetical protein [Chitinophagales bacterium]HPH86838.1 hypothetical protein [Chitinophagales bacterium]
MSLREYILKDLNAIRNPKLLQQCFEYIQTIKKTEKKESNKNKVLKFAGLLNNKQAVAITNSVKDNFNSIEGEW